MNVTRVYCQLVQVRDELEQLLDDDDDLAELYLSRKFVATVTPPDCSGAAATWYPSSSPRRLSGKFSRGSRGASLRGEERDAENLEMLLEVVNYCSF